ncbi:outer membrane beta-barrel domain-containing protein [Bdellovibrionota bacterium FG-1]
MRNTRPQLVSTTTLLLGIALLVRANPLFALETTPTPEATPSLEQSERVNVEDIKQKYWARGDENELGVVQNRIYSKDKKFEFGIFGGFVTTDPFLNVNNIGASLGFHFNEYFGLNVVGFKDLVRPSSALDYLRNPYPVGLGTDNSTNEPRWYLGSELQASIIYGKLSVIGKAIIHYDLHFLAGAGLTQTESGRNFTPEIGIGQQFFLTRVISLRADYRLMRYNEAILQKAGSPSSPNGTPLGDRTNWTNSITIGLDFLFDVRGSK